MFDQYQRIDACKFKLNDKTKFLICNPRYFDIDLNCLMLGNKTASPACGKNLGFYYDEQLDIDEQISNLCK